MMWERLSRRSIQFSLNLSKFLILTITSNYQDYANPITRHAMQDYPEDGGTGMMQVFNGTKMLLDIPSESHCSHPRPDILCRRASTVLFWSILYPWKIFLREIGGIGTYLRAFSRKGTLCLGPRRIPYWSKSWTMGFWSVVMPGY